MSKYLDDFKLIIRECDYSNTYKMAWSKAIVELSGKYINDSSSTIVIKISDIAEKMFKYYWDQTIYFNLFQSAPNQPPIILQHVRKIIDLYQEYKNDYKPVVYNKADDEIKKRFKNEFDKALKESVRNIKDNVGPFFLNYKKEKFPFYVFDKKLDYITFNQCDLKELYQNQQDLFDLINYRWSLMLEDYNSSPRIGKKVRIMDEQKIRRPKALTFFDKFLDYENEEHICFICGKQIPNDELSRDHVIPWSYMYSDDLWNLVYVHKGCNSSKSNATPTINEINKLKERNLKLQSELHEVWQNAFGTKNVKILQEFDYAIEHDYVDKFYLGCRGC